jgi:hypothetical protein
MTAADKFHSEKPRDIANEVEAHVAPLPRRMLTHLLALALQKGQGQPAASQPETDDPIQAIDAAETFVKTEFATRFPMAAGDLSPDLEKATSTLQTAIRGVMQQLDLGDGMLNSSALTGLAGRIDESVAPAVADFLRALFDQVVAHEKSTAKRAESVDSQALSQIDAIARQINFIAVNAAVEAARVGAAGKGFAIIAAEIKSLSQQSQKAVERIRSEMG